jgi:hypothetical protein
MHTIQIIVFWVMIPCNDVVRYQCFGGPCCLHLQGEVNGDRKGGMEMGKEYKRGKNACKSRESEERQ